MKNFFVIILVGLLLLGGMSTSAVLAAPGAGQDSATDSEVSATEIFGIGKGYVHPSISLQSKYVDNFYSSDTEAEDDLITTISPGLWLSLPATQNKFIPLTSTNEAPGGKGITRFQKEGDIGFQGALFYQADLAYHTDHPENDKTSHNAQGLLQYTLAGGMTFELSNAFLSSFDDYDNNSDATKSQYDSNLTNAIIYYRISPLLKLRTGYSLYTLDYDENLYSYRNREDQSASAYVIYQWLPKTEAFLQYQYIDSDFDNQYRSDLTAHNYFIGLKFGSRAKINGHLKVGYGSVDGSLDGVKDYSTYIGEGELSYAATVRDRFILSLSRLVNVSSSSAYLSTVNSRIQFRYQRVLTYKVSASIFAMYRNEDYRGGNITTEREDDTLAGGIRFKYAMQDWLYWNLGYTYTERDSNIDTNDYNSNSVLLSATIAF